MRKLEAFEMNIACLMVMLAGLLVGLLIVQSTCVYAEQVESKKFIKKISSPQIENNRTYRGIISYIGYDLEENRARVDVVGNVVPDGGTQGRGQLYFENDASKQLANLIHMAFIHQLQVEVWVHIRDAQGRQNVINTVNFKVASSN